MCTNAYSDNLSNAMKPSDFCYNFERRFDIQIDCMFLKKNYEKDISNGCSALNDLYCRKEKCNFYKKA